MIMRTLRLQVLDTDYSFDEDGIYPSINYNPEDPHRSYMENIETMPMTAGPGVFGLHENANIACALAETFVIFDTVLLMEVSVLPCRRCHGYTWYMLQALCVSCSWFS